MKLAANCRSTFPSRLLAAWITVSALMAAEYHGTVKSGGLPVPGVTITASQGERKAITTTNERGAFSFAELADGTWTIDVEMLGFAKLSREIGVAASVPSTDWELKLLSEDALLAVLQPAGVAAPTRGVQRPPQRGAFQQLNVSQSAPAGTFENDGAIRSEEVADLSQTSASSLIVQGSMSSAL